MTLYLKVSRKRSELAFNPRLHGMSEGSSLSKYLKAEQPAYLIMGPPRPCFIETFLSPGGKKRALFCPLCTFNPLFSRRLRHSRLIQ